MHELGPRGKLFVPRELQVSEWKQCAVYEDELKRLWPLSQKQREEDRQVCTRIRIPLGVLPRGTMRHFHQSRLKLGHYGLANMLDNACGKTLPTGVAKRRKGTVNEKSN